MFDWRVASQMDLGEEGINHMFDRGAHPLGGIFDRPAEMPVCGRGVTGSGPGPMGRRTPFLLRTAVRAPLSHGGGPNAGQDPERAVLQPLILQFQDG